jgi:hypothetical protein
MAQEDRRSVALPYRPQLPSGYGYLPFFHAQPVRFLADPSAWTIVDAFRDSWQGTLRQPRSLAPQVPVSSQAGECQDTKRHEHGAGQAVDPSQHACANSGAQGGDTTAEEHPPQG